MKQYDLLVVGNGFDLNLQYQTSYKDFLQWCLENQSNPSVENNILIHYFNSAVDGGLIDDDNWSSFEKLICNYLLFLDYIFDNGIVIFEDLDYVYGGKYQKASIKIQIKNLPLFVKNMFDLIIPWNHVYLRCFCEGEKKSFAMRARLSDIPNSELIIVNIDKPLPVSKSSINNYKQLLLKDLEGDLIVVEQLLRKYVEVATTNTKPVTNAISQIGSVSKILSFNYSHIAQKIFHLESGDVCYVHGDINGKIVLGIEENMVEDNKKHASDYLVFYKRFRRIDKGTNSNYRNTVVDYLTDQSNVVVFGHSLDVSDSSIFSEIFNKKCNYVIYCYKDALLYKKKLAKLITLDLLSWLYSRNKITFVVIND